MNPQQQISSIVRNIESSPILDGCGKPKITSCEIVNDVWYIDVDVNDLKVDCVDKIIDILCKYKSMMTYQMLTGQLTMRFVFDFNRII